MKDKKVIIATHGNLAEGFMSALKIIVGDTKNLKAVCCYMNDDFDLDSTIEELMKNHDFNKEDLVICTDMMGGSVNNGFVKFLEKYPFHLITNTNLGFLIDLLLSGEEISSKTLAKKVNDDLFGVKYANSIIHKYENDLEDL